MWGRHADRLPMLLVISQENMLSRPTACVPGWVALQMLPVAEASEEHYRSIKSPWSVSLLGCLNVASGL